MDITYLIVYLVDHLYCPDLSTPQRKRSNTTYKGSGFVYSVVTMPQNSRHKCAEVGYVLTQ